MEVSSFPGIEDLEIKWRKLQGQMLEKGVDACLVCSNVNIYYLTGEIFSGYFYLGTTGKPLCFSKRETSMRSDMTVIPIRKPEDISILLKEKGCALPRKLMLEGDQLTYNEYIRLQRAFNVEVIPDATTVLRNLRKIKTPWEIEQLRYSAQKQMEVYRLIPSCYQQGISDIVFQANIENLFRKHGSIGIFRGFGSNMEIHMGSLLAGDNAEAPTPYDFALGGAGVHPAAPIGANGTILKEGMAVMVDMAGNYTAYISDMTRTYSIGQLPEIAYKAHQTSIDIQKTIMKVALPGTFCAFLYNLAIEIVQSAGLADFFMGTKFQAKFIGHGLGIEINEPPVLTGRSEEILEENMTFALEPKFVLPGIGAVGVENTFLVTPGGLELLTAFPENIIELI